MSRLSKLPRFGRPERKKIHKQSHSGQNQLWELVRSNIKLTGRTDQTRQTRPDRPDRTDQTRPDRPDQTGQMESDLRKHNSGDTTKEQLWDWGGGGHISDSILGAQDTFSY